MLKNFLQPIQIAKTKNYFNTFPSMEKMKIWKKMKGKTEGKEKLEENMKGKGACQSAINVAVFYRNQK